MKALLLIIIGLGLVAGCSEMQKPKSASDIVSGWADPGINLPPENDIGFIRERLPESLAALRAGLGDDSQSVRMRSAYVAEKLGAQARPIVPDLIQQLQSDPSFLVRVYVASALAGIGHVDADGLRRLRESFRSEVHEQAKTHIAGALVRLNSPEQETDAWQWLLQSVSAFPPEPPTGGDAQQTFWERRWGAVQHLRSVRNKDDVLLPLLRKLRDNPGTPRWVIEQQISEAISEAEDRTSGSIQ